MITQIQAATRFPFLRHPAEVALIPAHARYHVALVLRPEGIDLIGQTPGFRHIFMDFAGPYGQQVSGLVRDNLAALTASDGTFSVPAFLEALGSDVVRVNGEPPRDTGEWNFEFRRTQWLNSRPVFSGLVENLIEEVVDFIIPASVHEMRSPWPLVEGLGIERARAVLRQLLMGADLERALSELDAADASRVAGRLVQEWAWRLAACGALSSHRPFSG